MASEIQRGWNNSMPRRSVAAWSRPRLTPQQREAIRQRLADGEDAQALALEYGISRRAVDHYQP